MIAFADSSALAKLYADEPGLQAVRELPLVVISELARVEVPAAIWRKQRCGELTATDAAVLTAEFEADYFGTESEPPRFLPIVVSSVVLQVAARAVRLHGLRAYEAVQLATAQAAHAELSDCDTFAAFDTALCEAAVREGFTLLPD
ncbi:MAG: type II toxin-antitoxin system VapC family toxin [Thermocrispum sp.]